MVGNQFITAGTGLTFSADNKTLNHTNSVTANTTSGLKYFTYDAQGHVTAGVNKTLGRGLNDQSNVIGHSNTAITAGTVGSATQMPVLTYDAYGHLTAVSNTTVYPPTTAGTNGQVWQADGVQAGAWVTPLTFTISGVDGGTAAANPVTETFRVLPNV